MALDDPCFLDLVEVGRRVQARQLSSVEVTQAVLARIERIDGRLKSYATLSSGLALAEAAQADAEIARGSIRGPLHGVPIAVKDLCHTKGIPTAAGMTIYRDYRPDHDATVVTRLREAGAVLLGKLKLTEATLCITLRSTHRLILGARNTGQESPRVAPASRLLQGFVTAQLAPTRLARSAFPRP
jgi:amidase